MISIIEIDYLKTIFFTPSMIVGPIRIIILILFLFAIKRTISLRASNQVGLDYIVSRYIIIISLIIILSFILTLVNAFDILSFLIISFIISIFIFLNLNLKKPLKQQLKKIRKRIIIYSVKRFELKKQLIDSKNLKKPKDHSKAHQIRLTKKQLFWQVGIAMTLAVTTFFTRYYFLLYDNYMLSDLWFKEFKILKLFNVQQGFYNQLSGEEVLINLYSKITGVTEAIALQSFGLLEASILSVIIFWSIYKISRGRYIPALVGTLSYIFLFYLLPFNIDLITKHSSLYLAMSIAFPLIIYTAEPESLRIKTSSYFKWTFILYFAIALTNSFVFLIVIPCMLFILLFIIERQRRSYFFKNVSAYGLALLVFTVVYFIITYVRDENFLEFIKRNILIISSYTYTPQLIIPLEQLMTAYLILSSSLVLVFIVLSIKNRQTWRWALAFSSFATLLLVIYYFQFNFVDNDLMHLLSTLLLPILLGCFMYIVAHLLNNITSKLKLNLPIKITTATIAFLAIIFFLRSQASFPFIKTETTKSEVLEAYNTINETLLPYTYTIVDTEINYDMTTGNHFFVNYNDFSNNYLKRDSLYFKNRNNKKYLKANPNIVIPPSTLIFVYDNTSYSKREDLVKQKEKSLTVLNDLKMRGRPIELFFSRPQLKIYEVVNTPKSSNISDLLFN